MERKTIAIENVLITIDRQEGGMGNIESLAASISRNGLINPITVVQFAPGEYEIIAGRRRLDAAKSLGWTEIPASVYDSGELREEEVQIAENVNRLDMHPLDEAVLYKKLLDHGEPLVEIAKISGRSKSAVYQRVELLRLIPDLKNRFRNGGLTMTQASMLGSFSPEAQASFEKYVQDFSEIEPIPSWKFKQGCVCYGGVSLKNTHFSKCAECKTRTHYSDTSLFPELEGESDQCLNRDCFEEQYIAWVQDAVSYAYEKQGDSFREIAAPPVIIEDSNIGILTKVFKNGLLVDSIVFAVIPDDNFEIIENELDSSDAPEWLLACRDSIKPCFYISSEMNISFFHYISSDEYREAKYGPDDDEDDEVEYEVSIENDAERDAYREIMGSSWEIKSLVKKKVLSQIVVETYDTKVTANAFKDIILNVLSKDDLIEILTAHDHTLDSTAIEDGSWAHDRSIEWMKSFAYDVLLSKRIKKIYLSPGQDMFEEDVSFITSIGLDPQTLQESVKSAYVTEIRCRMNNIIGKEDGERRAVSADTFSPTERGEEEDSN